MKVLIVVESMHAGYGFGNWGDSILTEEQPFAPPGRSRELERHLAGFRSMEQQIFEATHVGWIEGVSLRYGSFYGPESTAPLIDLLRRRSLPLPTGGQTFQHSKLPVRGFVSAILPNLLSALRARLTLTKRK